MTGPARLKTPARVIGVRELSYFLIIVAISLIVGLLIPDGRASLAVALAVSTLGAVALVVGWFRLLAYRAGRPMATSRELAERTVPPRSSRAYQVPRELPPAPSGFVGRDEELGRLRQGIAGTRDGGTYVAVIYGEPGIGKSALAITAAHQGAAYFPGGQVFVQMRAAGTRPPSVKRVLEHFVASLKGPEDLPPAASELQSRYLELANQYSVLLVLDDLAPEFDISALLPVGTHGAVLITCRTDPAWPGVGYERIRLSPLRPNDAVDMLRKTVAAETAAADPAEEAAASAGRDSPADQPYFVELARRCGREPLALQAAGTALADRPDWGISLLAERARSRFRSAGNAVPRRGIFDAAYALLTTDEQKALRVLGVLQKGDLAPWMIAAALGIAENRRDQEGERLATRLAGAGLIERYNPGSGTPWYWVEDPVREYARMRADLEDDPTEVQGWRESVIREQGWRNAQPDQRFGGLDDLLKQYAGFTPAIDAVRQAMSLAREQESRQAEAHACAALADLYTDLGDVVTAEDLARQAITLAGDGVDEQSEARAHRCLTRLDRRRGRFGAAIGHANTGMACALRAEDGPELVRILVEKAVVVSLQGHAREAGQIAAEALTRCGSLDSADARSLEVAVKWCQGRIWLHAGRYSAAAGILREDRELAQELGEKRMVGWIDHTSAGVSLAVRDWVAAEHQAIAGMDNFTELQHQYGVAHCRHRLGKIRLKRDRFDDAIRLLRDSLESFHNCEDIWIESEVSLDLADAYLRSGRIQDAIQMQRVARRDYRQMGSSSLNRRTAELFARTLLAAILPRHKRDPEGARPGTA
jgi:tetratricopeptide (TPR) repeat protein